MEGWSGGVFRLVRIKTSWSRQLGGKTIGRGSGIVSHISTYNPGHPHQLEFILTSINNPDICDCNCILRTNTNHFKSL